MNGVLLSGLPKVERVAFLLTMATNVFEKQFLLVWLRFPRSASGLLPFTAIVFKTNQERVCNRGRFFLARAVMNAESNNEVALLFKRKMGLEKISLHSVTRATDVNSMCFLLCYSTSASVNAYI